jgi:hypothetical protein
MEHGVRRGRVSGGRSKPVAWRVPPGPGATPLKPGPRRRNAHRQRLANYSRPALPMPGNHLPSREPAVASARGRTSDNLASRKPNAGGVQRRTSGRSIATRRTPEPCLPESAGTEAAGLWAFLSIRSPEADRVSAARSVRLAGRRHVREAGSCRVPTTFTGQFLPPLRRNPLMCRGRRTGALHRRAPCEPPATSRSHQPSPEACRIISPGLAGRAALPVPGNTSPMTSPTASLYDGPGCNQTRQHEATVTRARRRRQAC